MRNGPSPWGRAGAAIRIRREAIIRRGIITRSTLTRSHLRLLKQRSDIDAAGGRTPDR